MFDNLLFLEINKDVDMSVILELSRNIFRRDILFIFNAISRLKEKEKLRFFFSADR